MRAIFSAEAQCRSMRSASVLRPRSARKRIERPLDGADGVLQEREPLAQLGVVADDRDAADHVGMAVEIFRGRVHDEVEAEFERALHIGAREGVVGGGAGCRAACAIAAIALEIDELQQRIGRRLDPDQPRVRAGSRLRARRGRSRSTIADLEARRALAHALEQPPRAAVEIVDRDDVRAVVEAVRAAVAIAARPEAKAKPALPPSRSAMQRSNAMRVGFLVRA